MCSITEVKNLTLFQGKGKGKGKGKKSEAAEKKKPEVKIVDWPQNCTRLRSLDVFAGCGGMSF